MEQFKKGDKVVLIKTTKSLIEEKNWLKNEPFFGNNPKKFDEFEVKEVNENGDWVDLIGLELSHPSEKFTLAK